MTISIHVEKLRHFTPHEARFSTRIILNPTPRFIKINLL